MPLFIKKPHKWTTIFYENYLKNRDEIVNSIFDVLRMDNTSFSVSKFVNKPSMSVQKSDIKTVKKPDKQLSKWKNVLSEKQINKILNVVSIFNLDFYNKNPEPDYDKLPK